MSLVIERITQRLSACFATFGNSSLTSRPDCPCCANLNGEAKMFPARALCTGCRRSLIESGSGLPSSFVSCGFGSKVSICDGPPFMNRWMTRLIFAGKCGCFTDIGFKSAASSAARRKSEAASAPRPKPERWRKWRRETLSKFMRLVLLKVVPPIQSDHRFLFRFGSM